MKPHEERVVEEKKQLDEKTDALASFCLSRVFKTLDGDEQGRLNRQHRIMIEYSQVLDQRIEAFC